MDLRQLRYFVAVARTGSFSRGSAGLHIAQPAVSTQIASLEDELGLRLLVRHSRGVELTPAGAHLLTGAEDILKRVETLRSETQDLGGIQGEVRLGIPTTTTPVLAPPLMERMRQVMPGVELHVTEAMTGHLERWLERDDLDVAILFGSAVTERLEHIDIGTEALVLIGPAEGELAQLAEVDLATVLTLPLVHSTAGHTLRRFIDHHCRQLRCPPRITAEIDSLTQIKSFVFNGKGYTILPQSAVCPDWVFGRIRYWPVKDPDFRLKLVLVASERFQRMPHCNSTLRLIESVAHHLIRTGVWAGARIEGPPEEMGPVIGRW